MAPSRSTQTRETKRKGIPEVRLTEQEKKLKTSFDKRLPTLKRKASQLATLCDVPVCLLCLGPDGAFHTWPENSDDVKGIVGRYRNLGERDKREKNLELGVAPDKEAMKENMESRFVTWDEKLDNLSREDLVGLETYLEAKIQILNQKSRLLRLEKEKTAFQVADGSHVDHNGILISSLSSRMELDQFRQSSLPLVSPSGHATTHTQVFDGRYVDLDWTLINSLSSLMEPEFHQASAPVVGPSDHATTAANESIWPCNHDDTLWPSNCDYGPIMGSGSFSSDSFWERNMEVGCFLRENMKANTGFGRLLEENMTANTGFGCFVEENVKANTGVSCFLKENMGYDIMTNGCDFMSAEIDRGTLFINDNNVPLRFQQVDASSTGEEPSASTGQNDNKVLPNWQTVALQTPLHEVLPLPVWRKQPEESHLQPSQP